MKEHPMDIGIARDYQAYAERIDELEVTLAKLTRERDLWRAEALAAGACATAPNDSYWGTHDFWQAQRAARVAEGLE